MQESHLQLVADDTLISSLNRNLLIAYKAEEKYWKQRSRQTWLALGDRNTACFHAQTKGRRARSRITVIETSEGIPVFEDEQIAATISTYYYGIFESTNPPAAELVLQALSPCISEATNEKLIAIPSLREIKTTLFSIHPDKAPGPDGFSASFFQSNWDIVGSGRAISDNVLITHEMLHYLKNSGATIHCSMAVKTDISKAPF